MASSLKKQHLLSASIFVGLLFCFPTLHAATYTVANNNNSGAGSLRQAILDANSNAGTDNIDFNIAGSTVLARTITLSSDLPDLMGTVIIDGTTQPNGGVLGVSDAKIIIDGGTSNHIFILEADDIEIYGIYMKDSDTRLYIASAYTGCIIGAASKGNVIAGTTADGIRAEGDNTVIKANFIGIEPDGVTLRTNTGHGIFIRPGTDDVIIGGTPLGEGNVISGNSRDGVRSQGTDIMIEGNFIGTDVNGTSAIPNGGDGIYLDLGADADLATINNNVISGNTDGGIYCTDGSLNVTNNIIGTDSSETINLGNTLEEGIFINSGASSTITILNNTISNNGGAGIYNYNKNMIVKGNYIGTNSAHTLDMGNGGDGVHLNGADSCLIGDFGAGEGNIIAYNGGIGVGIDGNSNLVIKNTIHHNESEGVDLVSNGDYNLITQNSFYCNALSSGVPRGIDTQTGNEGVLSPTIVSINATTITGTSGANLVIELFEGDNCAYCEGKTYIAATVANGAGNWSFSGAFAGTSYTTTATNSNRSTSEFSRDDAGCTAGVLPIELLSFSGKSSGNVNLLEWTTATEINNDYFTIEKSEDAENWEELTQVTGAGNSLQNLFYNTTDQEPFNHTYYRLKQTDFNGKFSYSNIIFIETELNNELLVSNIYPNPNQGFFEFINYTNEDKIILRIKNSQGKLVKQKIFLSVLKGSINKVKKMNLPGGIYTVQFQTGQAINTQKIVITN